MCINHKPSHCVCISYHKLDMHSLAAANRPRLSETDPKLFVFETMPSVGDIALNLSLRKKSKREYS